MVPLFYFRTTTLCPSLKPDGDSSCTKYLPTGNLERLTAELAPTPVRNAKRPLAENTFSTLPAGAFTCKVRFSNCI